MPRKKHKPAKIVAKSRQMDVAVAPSTPPAEVTRGIGVGEVTYRRWLTEYSGLKLDQVKPLRELEQEDSRPR